MNRPLPPMMTAPDRNRPTMRHTPKIPHSLKKQAEALVVQAAKELSANTDGASCEDWPLADLHDAVRILRQLEG